MNRHVMARPLLFALGEIMLLAVSGQALAQASNTVTPGKNITTPQQLTTAPDAATGTEVEQVVVTARRRNESVQSTPLAVTAISPSQLANVAAPDTTDLNGRVPSLNISSVGAGPSAASVTIRGIGFADIEKSFDPAVGVLVDDVYIGTNTGQLTDTFDLQSLEVLRGPQGTLFGRNTIGGVVTIQRTRPTGLLGGYADATVGDYGRRDYHVLLNLPKLFDQLSTKIFYSSRSNDGYEHNVTLNRSDTDRDDVKRYGVVFLWQPTSAFDLNLTIEHENERSLIDQASLSSSTDLLCSGIPGVIPANTPPFTAPANECNRNTRNDLYTTYSNKPGGGDNNENDITAQATWRLGPVTLNSVTGYRKNNEDVSQDFDATSIDFYETERKQVYHQFSQELRASGNIIEGIDYVVGGYYFDSLYNLHQSTILPFLSGVGQQYTTGKSISYATFGDVDWHFASKFRLSVGARYTADHKSLIQDFPNEAGFPLGVSHSWNEFTPKASLDYQIDRDALVYVSASKGYRSGGLNGRGQTVSTVDTPYNPETVDAYEIGAKTQWLNRRLTINVSAYDNEYNNKQESVVEAAPPGSATPDQTVVANAAGARIYGLEIEMQARPVPPLDLRATLGLLHATYSSFSQVDPSNPGKTDDLSNLQLIMAPPVTGGAGFDYHFPQTTYGRFTLVGDYRYVAGHQTVITAAPGTGGYFGANGAYINAVNDPRGYSQEAHTIDTSLTWDHDVTGGVLRVTGFARNLLDNKGLESGLAVASLFTFGYPRAPRTYGVTVAYKF